uniref:Uncharacterized protein n=1 Tax=Arundo donax TaxID=35708 RepID=A0A0A9BHM8_ARUDO
MTFIIRMGPTKLGISCFLSYNGRGESRNMC